MGRAAGVRTRKGYSRDVLAIKKIRLAILLERTALQGAECDEAVSHCNALIALLNKAADRIPDSGKDDKAA